MKAISATLQLYQTDLGVGMCAKLSKQAVANLHLRVAESEVEAGRNLEKKGAMYAF
jgi:hypothetical protein